MIRQLPQDVIDRIAAGEVVERPASVVKELLENALDAGARSLSIEVQSGGLGLVRVADDGRGFAPGDLPLAFAAHATSKLHDVDDLEHIGSFGFRGEALSSIGAVSRTRLTSSTDGSDGQRLDCEAGRVTGPVPAACSRGTVIEVRDLFFNVPARRRFLGAARTESARCREVVAAMALCHPEVRFELVSEGRPRLSLEPAGNLGRRIAAIYGRDLFDELVPLRGGLPGLAVEGYVSLPSAARPRPRLQQVFVNGRHVRDRGVLAAVRSGCKDFLPGSLQPSFVVQLNLDPARVDVNVHPTKAEVRFRDRDEVFRAVCRSCREALLAADLSPRVSATTLDGLAAIPATTRPPLPGASTSPAVAGPTSSTGPIGAESTSPSLPWSAPGEVRESPASVPAPAPRPVGRYLQVLDTYLLHEGDEGLVIVDQHALHERVLYSRLQRELAEGRIESQRLLVPETVTLDPSDHERALEMADELRGLGLDLDEFGDDTLAVRAVPVVLRHESLPDLVAALVHPPELHGGIPHGLDRRLFTMACHAAVKAGDPLDEQEVADLMRQGAELEHDATCPHGRPTRLVVGKAELERLFKRSGF